MRVQAFLFGLTVTLAAAAAAMQACGGDTGSSSSSDAGNDVAPDTAKEASPPDTGSPDSATCDLGADFTAKIPDAAIADGQSTTGLCIGCVEANCKKDVDKCNQYCPCQGAADKALSCYAQHTDNPFACAGTVAGTDQKTQGILIGLGGCLQQKCQKACPVPDGGFDAGGD